MRKNVRSSVRAVTGSVLSTAYFMTFPFSVSASDENLITLSSERERIKIEKTMSSLEISPKEISRHPGARPLGSGRNIEQIGLLYCHLDPCNTRGAMVARTDQGWEARITRKENPGQKTSSACGNNGYKPEQPVPLGQGKNIRIVIEQKSPRSPLVIFVLIDGQVRYSRGTSPCSGGFVLRSDNLVGTIAISGGRENASARR